MDHTQAATLLAHHFYYRLNRTASKDQPPPQAKVDEIKRDYASSIAFLIGALGTRGRWLRLIVDNKGVPKPDEELRTHAGVPVPGAWLVRGPWLCPLLLLLSMPGVGPHFCIVCPASRMTGALCRFLPADLCTAVTNTLYEGAPKGRALRIDGEERLRRHALACTRMVPTSLTGPCRSAPRFTCTAEKVRDEVSSQLSALQVLVEEMLNLPADVELPSAPSVNPTASERAVKRVINVDNGLRALLKAGSLSERDFESNFGASKHIAHVLAEKHIVFYNLRTKTVEPESDVLQRVIAAVLDSPEQHARKELAQKLLDWQRAKTQLTDATAAEERAEKALASAVTLFDLETRPAGVFSSKPKATEVTVQRKEAAAADRDNATKERKAAEAAVKMLEARIQQLRSIVPQAPPSAS